MYLHLYVKKLMVVQYLSIAICWSGSAPLPQEASQTMNRHKNTNSFAVHNILTVANSNAPHDSMVVEYVG